MNFGNKTGIGSSCGFTVVADLIPAVTCEVRPGFLRLYSSKSARGLGNSDQGAIDKGIERTYRLLAVLSDDQGLCALAFQCKECKALALRPSKAKRKQRNNAEMLLVTCTGLRIGIQALAPVIRRVFSPAV
jgi:hypothetical protein